MRRSNWWEHWWAVAAFMLLSTIPLWFPETPPLVDVPGHLGRYRVQLDLATSPDLQRYFQFHWALIGNLGADLLLIPLAPLFGLEAAFKLIILTIPPLTVLGIFLVAREVHGKIPPTALFAVPLVYGYPFNFGFINFSLSIALALLAFAGWLRLASRRQFRLRAMLFVPLSCVIWTAHVFGWGVLGLLAFSAEAVRHRDEGKTWLRSAIQASVDVSVLALPLLFMFAWRSHAPQGEMGAIIPIWKFYAFISAMRDKWPIWDSFGVAAVLVLIGSAIFDKHLTLSRKVAIPAATLLLAFLLLPYVVFSSAYADMRLVPFTLIIAVIAIRRRDGNSSGDSLIAALGAGFILLRLAGNTISFIEADVAARERLAALDHVPKGTAVLTLVRGDCGDDWELPRYAHFGGFVIARKYGFANEQWQLPGSQLLSVHYDAAGDFQGDDLKGVFPRKCLARFEAIRKRTNSIFARKPKPANSAESAIAKFPRAAFDYVWMIDPPEFDMKARPGLVPIWRGRDSVLYRIQTTK